MSDSPSAAYLEVVRVSKSFAEIPVLNEVSLSLERGKCLALLGPSGCGKSTLLNIVAGLLPADGGFLRFDGEVIEDAETGHVVPAQQRRFSMVFQDLSLWPHMTVYENVAFGLQIQGVAMEERRRRVEEALNRTGIFALRHRAPSTLSGGQQQRVAIARAIVVEPAVLLMDEPLAALDTNLRESMRDEIAALIRRLGITCIYVTHDHSEAMTVAHRVAIMNNGRIEQIASPREIYDQPATTFVASFLGSANCFPYSYELEAIRDSDGEALFPAHPLGAQRGFLMVRREHVRIFPANRSDEFPVDNMVQWEATCLKNSFSGERYEIHAVTQKGEIFRGFAQEPLALDSRVLVQFDPAQIIFVEK